MERLDQILVNVSLLSTFTAVYTSILPFAASDHYPTALTLESHCPLGPLPFKYNPLWNDIAAAKDLIQQTWRQHVEGSPSFIWESKLRNVKNALKDWEKTHYKEPEAKKREVKAKIEEFHHIMEKQEYYQGGDRNTAFFHKQATVRQIRNSITTITDSTGIQHNEKVAIKNTALEHFKEILTEKGEEENFADLLQHLPNKIAAETNERLTKEIKEEEIKGAIWGLQPDKALGPNGFPIFFYREHWATIKKDLIK
eukprot:PITA_13716